MTEVSTRTGVVAALLAIACVPPLPASAYIDGGGVRITLPEILLEFRSAAVLTVEALDAGRGAVRFKIAERLKGTGEPPAAVRQLLRKDGATPGFVAGVKPGDRAVWFSGCHDKRSLTLLGGVWYVTAEADGAGWERLTAERPDCTAVFLGTAPELADAVRALLRGRAVAVPFRPGGAGDGRGFVAYSLAEPHRKQLVPDPSGAGVAAKTPAQWLAELDSRDTVARQVAAHALGMLPTSPEAVARLIAALKDSDAEVRITAAESLGRLKSDPAATVAALTAALEDGDRFVCVAAAQALEAFGPEAAPAVPALRKALADRNWSFDFRPLRAAAAAEALLKIAPAEGGPALELLTRRLLDDDRPDSYGTRAAGAAALGRIGPAAAPALPRLLARLDDRESSVRTAAAEAVLRIGADAEAGRRAVDALAAGFGSGSLIDRLAAVAAVRRLGPKAAATADRLSRLSTDPEPEIRAAAAEALKAVR
jgi:HEAT repeat protein